jgi:hypothetical protein
VQDVRARGVGQIGPVVDREQRPVLGRLLPEHVEEGQLLRGFQALLPELHHVHAGPEHRVEELRQVALPLARVHAQVQPGLGQPVPDTRHLVRPPVVRSAMIRQVARQRQPAR